MPAKKITKRTVKTVQDIKPEIVSVDSCCSSCAFFRKNILLVLVAVVVLMGVLGYFFRDKILVAIVNNRPIFRYTLSEQLISTYGKNSLENLIVDSLIKEEAAKNKVEISEKDVDSESEKISSTLGGISLEEALKMQGMSLADFRDQLRTRLQVYKILEKEISVSKDEIDQFLKENEKTLTATTEAEKRTEAESVLKEQKLSEKIQSWINDLLAKAKISRFLK